MPVVVILTLLSMMFFCEHITERVTRFELPKGELKWTKTRRYGMLCIGFANMHRRHHTFEAKHRNASL